MQIIIKLIILGFIINFIGCTSMQEIRAEALVFMTPEEFSMTMGGDLCKGILVIRQCGK